MMWMPILTEPTMLLAHLVVLTFAGVMSSTVTTEALQDLGEVTQAPASDPVSAPQENSSTGKIDNSSSVETATEESASQAPEVSTKESSVDPKSDNVPKENYETTMPAVIETSSISAVESASVNNTEKKTVPESSAKNSTIREVTTIREITESQSETEAKSGTISSMVDSDTTVKPDVGGSESTTPLSVQYDLEWMEYFTRSHHFEGQYFYDSVIYVFDFVVRYVHPSDLRTLVASFHDQDGAVLEFNGTSTDGHVITFKMVHTYVSDTRFPFNVQFEIVGSIVDNGQGQYFSGNITKPENFSFSWIHMSKGMGSIETGETAGTRTAIIIIIPTSIAFLGICGTVAIICWASKKGYLRGRHKSYRLFTNAQVSYESEAETIHI